MKWRIRDLLNPVVTRSMIYGADPFDIEYVLQKVDRIEKMSGKEVKNVWFSEWQRKAQIYLKNAVKSEKKGRTISAREYYMMTAQCCYACYMINMDDIELKRGVYNCLAKYYKKAVSFRSNLVEYVEIPFGDVVIPAYLHFPDNGKSDKPYSCVMTYSGIGSCKEELDMLALPLNERGIAVLCVDMPGTGSSLFDYDLKCNGAVIESAFKAMHDYLVSCSDIDAKNLANYGLCMGGGYAFRASSLMPDVKCCVSLFPLLLDIADVDSVPIWMKRGKWANFQHGTIDGETFLNEMKTLGQGEISCDFLMVHSADDNWMDTDATMKIFNRANGYKERFPVVEKPAYVSEETIMHAMPVGEQFHWVKHIASDFIAERLK
ncbi:MAG: esterase FrsA, partial [Ruminococcus sp.]|nr:esterase FrsA [Ruminococcus sp.]